MGISNKVRMSVVSLLSTCVLVPTATVAGPSFAGPDSVAKYHPLCLEKLKGWERDGGALGMQKCAYDQRKIKVTKTSQGAYFASRNKDDGYMAYKPIGSLDNSMDLLLVYNKQQANPLTSIYFVGRIAGTQLTRDFLTTIEDGGDRCFGGVNAARLVSESKLEVDINATVNQIMTFADDSATNALDTISFKPDNYQAYACAGVITKTYDLISSDIEYTKVTFTRDESRKVIDPSSRCYDKLVAEQLSAPRVLDMDQYREFVTLYNQQCRI